MKVMRWKRLTQPRFLFVYPLVLALFVFSQVTDASLRAGSVLILLGVALRVWANGYIGDRKVNETKGTGKVGQLMTAGPYAFVRHPLYLGSFLIGAGFCLTMGNLWVSLAAFAAFAGAYADKMRQEDELLRAECGPAWVDYAAAVPQLIPRRRRYPHRRGQWSWQGIAASKEWKTVSWVAVVMILVYFWKETVQKHEGLFAERPLYHLTLLGVAVALIAFDGLMELMTRRAKPQMIGREPA